jgi:hypothetical protein
VPAFTDTSPLYEFPDVGARRDERPGATATDLGFNVELRTRLLTVVADPGTTVPASSSTARRRRRRGRGVVQRRRRDDGR